MISGFLFCLIFRGWVGGVYNVLGITFKSTPMGNSRLSKIYHEPSTFPFSTCCLFHSVGGSTNELFLEQNCRVFYHSYCSRPASVLPGYLFLFGYFSSAAVDIKLFLWWSLLVGIARDNKLIALNGYYNATHSDKLLLRINWAECKNIFTQNNNRIYHQPNQPPTSQ